MSLQQLSLSSFRNLKDDTLDLHPATNLIHGRNASGKTGFLEAVSIISQGKSFRTHRLAHCIRHEATSFLLFGRFNDARCGFRYGKKDREIRLNGEQLHSIKPLAERRAVLVLDTQTLELISGKPDRRRQFIDWLLFHVEPDYADLWNRCHKLLKQRNALLRSRHPIDQLKYWDQELIEASEHIDLVRRRVISEVLSDTGEWSVTYSAGFDTDYEGQLSRSRADDIRLGYTRFHFNRADLSFRNRYNEAMVQSASRGQIKSFAIELQVRALEYIRNTTRKPVMLLTDDMAAELDTENLSKLYQRMLDMNAQLFVSALDPDDFPDLLTDQCRMFHVEHGMMGPGST